MRKAFGASCMAGCEQQWQDLLEQNPSLPPGAPCPIHHQVAHLCLPGKDVQGLVSTPGGPGSRTEMPQSWALVAQLTPCYWQPAALHLPTPGPPAGCLGERIQEQTKLGLRPLLNFDYLTLGLEEGRLSFKLINLLPKPSRVLLGPPSVQSLSWTLWVSMSLSHPFFTRFFLARLPTLCICFDSLLLMPHNSSS